MAYVPPEPGAPFPRPGWQKNWKDPYNYEWAPENNESTSYIPKNTKLFWLINGSEDDISCLPRAVRGLAVGATIGAFYARYILIHNTPKHYISKVLPSFVPTFTKNMGYGSMIGLTYFASKCFAEGVFETTDWKSDVIATGCTCGTVAAMMGKLTPAVQIMSASWVCIGMYQITRKLGKLQQESASSVYPQRVWNWKMGNPQSPVFNAVDYDPMDKINHLERKPLQNTVENSE